MPPDRARVTVSRRHWCRDATGRGRRRSVGPRHAPPNHPSGRRRSRCDACGSAGSRDAPWNRTNGRGRVPEWCPAVVACIWRTGRPSDGRRGSLAHGPTGGMAPDGPRVSRTRNLPAESASGRHSPVDPCAWTPSLTAGRGVDGGSESVAHSRTVRGGPAVAGDHSQTGRTVGSASERPPTGDAVGPGPHDDRWTDSRRCGCGRGPQRTGTAGGPGTAKGPSTPRRPSLGIGSTLGGGWTAEAARPHIASRAGARRRRTT